LPCHLDYNVYNLDTGLFMDKNFILLPRDDFREGVFARDNYKCVFCGKTAEETPEGKLDAHHILERRLWPDGGYYLANGATVCEEHHLECERTTITVGEVMEAAGITKRIVPPHLS
jgi:predicted restriction endonuclease